MAHRTITYNAQSLDIAYLKQSPKGESSGVIVFLHGWGSNKELMHMAFGKTFASYTHYYIDLPGFGASAYGESNAYGLDSSGSIAGTRLEMPTLEMPVLETRDYAAIVDEFFAALRIVPDIVVGHSFGGKVAMLCAGEQVILLSSAGIVRPKSWRVRAKIACAKLAKRLGLRLSFLRAKDGQNLNPVMYETFKRVVDEDFSHIFAASTKRVSIFWGVQDSATPLDSGRQIHALIKGSRFFPLAGDHYFFLQQGAEMEAMFNLQCLHIRVLGKVQGVGYRKFAKANAEALGIQGSAQNLPDGSVEIYAYGSEKALAKLIERLLQGPERAIVQSVDGKGIVRGLDQAGFVILPDSAPDPMQNP